jgi:hypothetical protein
MKRILFLLLLTGCATTEEFNANIETRWLGRDIDGLITAIGPPMQSHVTDGGQYLSWKMMRYMDYGFKVVEVSCADGCMAPRSAKAGTVSYCQVNVVTKDSVITNIQGVGRGCR